MRGQGGAECASCVEQAQTKRGDRTGHKKTNVTNTMTTEEGGEGGGGGGGGGREGGGVGGGGG